MRIQIESTDEVTYLDGVPVRRWRGTTESGIPCEVFVHRIALSRDADASEFDRELREQHPPGVRVVPLSDIL